MDDRSQSESRNAAPTLYDVLAVPAPDGLERGETRITRAAPETTDEAPSVFPTVGFDA